MTGTNGTPALAASQQTIDVLNDSAALAKLSPDQLGAVIDRRNALMDKLREAALKATRSEQWADMGGKPWPTAAAAETIARRCAVKIHGVSYRVEERNDDAGDFYFYVYTGTVELPGGLDSAEVVGTCSSRDQFLGTETSEGRSLSEINEDDILKAAYSNLIVNGVMRLLGLRGFTWESLAAYGITPDGAQKATFKAGSKGGGGGQSALDVDIKFGKGKGKKLSELSPEDFAWYVAAWERDLTDPEKKKYEANTKRSLEIAKAIQAKRANEQAGTTAAGPSGQTPSVWSRIRSLDQTIPEAVLIETVKKATGKATGKDLVEADIAKVAEALKAAKAQKHDDIPF